MDPLTSGALKLKIKKHLLEIQAEGDLMECQQSSWNALDYNLYEKLTTVSTELKKHSPVFRQLIKITKLIFSILILLSSQIGSHRGGV